MTWKKTEYEELHCNLTSLPLNIRDKCLLIHRFVETLLLTKADHSVHEDREE